jgi:hypothetical protein
MDLDPLEMVATTQAIAAAGGKPARVVRAPIAAARESKRGPIIDKEEADLESNMATLEEGTRAKNREFQAHLDAIKERGVRWEAKLEEETAHRDAAFDEIKAAAERSITAAYEEMEEKVTAAFDHFDAESIPPLEQSCQVLVDGFDRFEHVTVPGMIEELVAATSRRLHRQHEAFDIDNTKLLNREKKIVVRTQVHQARCRQSFVDEETTRFHKFLLLGEELDETARTDDRAEEQMQTRTLKQTAELQEDLQAECKVREGEDLEILENLAGSMSRLQQSILVNFGMGAEREYAEAKAKAAKSSS